MSISNQKILIVGGGSGMGLALARRCSEAGAEVIIAGRGENRLRQAREALGNPAGLETAMAEQLPVGRIGNPMTSRTPARRDCP
ncbi:SDR family NAD(P)-dependent oxidoreductase, partial [Mesorhizobium sp. M7A.F.Ca.MR.362.00.0.0]|uniref:SDR family NAD(P)-dependent oxidoreductase n=1 Tax=Mesorhizobium sp. M7A.F.Ca.MR.362.00.0.0 TaxID=2496779 RepID=UPI001FDFF63C